MAQWVLRPTLISLLTCRQIFGATGFLGESPKVEFSDWAPMLDFYDQNDREVVAGDLPRRTCNHRRPSFLWMPFVRSRLRLTPDHTSYVGFWRPSSFALPVSLPRRDFCKWLGGGAGSQSPLGFLCQDCSREPCIKAARFATGTSDIVFDLPPQLDACVWLEQLPAGATKVRVTWEQHLDPWVFGRVLLGAALMSFHVSLRTSTVVHAGLGGVSAAAVLLMLAAWTFAQSTKKTIQGSIPLGGLLTSSTTLLLFFSPWARQAFVHALYGNMSQYAILKSWLEWHDPVMNLPIGLIATISAFVITLFTVTWGARWSMRFFASEPDPEGEVAFIIGSDGRRIDILPAAPLPQRCLGWSIWHLGLALLLSSTYLDSCSLGLTLLILCWDIILRVACRPFDAMLKNEFEPGNLRSLISSSTFEEQGKQHTARALQDFRQYLNTHTSVMDHCAQMREGTELKMRRFADGLGHFHHPVDTFDRSEPSARWCSIL